MPPTDILVFGEDVNDCAAVAQLVKAVLKTSPLPTVRPIRRPIILSRSAAPQKRSRVAQEIANFAKSFEKAGKSVTVVAHRDCDAIEPAHLTEGDSLVKDLKASGVRSVVAATPAWEIESWWMLFPAALRMIRPSWRSVDYGKTHVGKIEHAKERLTRDLRPAGNHSCRDFHESDGAKIAEVVARDKSHLENVVARSDSFLAFRDALITECR